MSTIVPGSITMEACSARGGYKTVMPSGPDAGKPCCRSGSGATLTYQLLNESFGDYFARVFTNASESVDIALGGAVQARDDALDAVGVKDGALGVGSKLLGINLQWLVWALVAFMFYAVSQGQGGVIARAARGK